MKRLILITLVALFSSGLVMAQKAPKAETVSKKTISYLKYSDGYLDSLVGSNTVKRRDSLWLAKHQTPPVVVPPVSSKPIFTPPTGNYLDVQLISDKSINLDDLIKTNKLIKFKAGSYKNIYLYSYNTINDIVLDAVNVKSCENCTIELSKGNNVKIYGWNATNSNNRAIKFGFGLNGFEIYNSSFKNITSDYSIAVEKVNWAFPLVNTGFKLINSTFDNSSAVALSGEKNTDLKKDEGVFKDVVISFNLFKNAPNAGKFVEIGNSWNYDVHDNIIDNINALQNNHNGVFELQGSGKFYNNKFTNYQGNSVRMWLFSRGNTPYTVQIYNNLCYNTRKYSGFEIQEFARNIESGVTTFANAKVYNNTVGKMNADLGWEGQILDLYNISGSLLFYNNLGFELNRAGGKPTTDMINYNGNSKPAVTPKNSIYTNTWEDAVKNTIDFESLFPGIGYKSN